MQNPIEIVDNHYVVICGKCIHRPESIAPSQWAQMWEDAKKAAARNTPYR